MAARAMITAAAALLLVQGASADMGRVTLESTGVAVSESAQKAIILHNDQQEVLILGTEIGATKKTQIVRFIPFPSEPQVSLAPKGTFERLAAIVAKYKLEYVIAHHSKGGKDAATTSGVEVRLKATLGAHDITVFRVRDAAVFRAWVNKYFHNKGRPRAFPKEEAIVADYVARGFDYFVLDAVELQNAKEYIDPVVYRFASKSLYYPLKTSNTFGGRGEIELFIVAPTTLCAPGSNIFLDESDKAVDAQGRATGPCLNMNIKASTSAQLVPQEGDLAAIYSEGEAFFGKRPVFLQAMHYAGDYQFKDDILVAMPQGMPKALRVEIENSDDIFAHVLDEPRAECRKKPDPGVCKGRFDAYYFDEQSKSCKLFFWGGCGGVVPFETLETCQKTCMTPH